MAIIANISTEVGDVISIKADVPIVGLLALTDFTDTVVGETITRYFDKTFRYSIDGINWSVWTALTVPNVQAVVVDPTNVFMIEYRYARVGDPGGDLQFDNATLEAQQQPHECGPAFGSSVFSQFFECVDIEMMTWCINVLEKLYQSGIVPEYITRGSMSNLNSSDKDYLDFWRTISCYFSLFVKYARTFETFQNNQFLLHKYLQNRGMFNCTDTEHLDLLHLMNHFWDEMRQRGLQLMTIKKDTPLSGGRLKEVDGEVLRMICHEACDEFIFSLTEPENTSWNLNNSSPLFTGLHAHSNVVKGYAKKSSTLSQMPTPVDLAEYPLVESSFISVISDVDNEGNAISAISVVATGSGIKSGIGLDAAGASISTANAPLGIVYDPCMDYEVTFMVKKVSGKVYVDFSFFSYTENGVGPLNMLSASGIPSSGSTLNNFLFEESLEDFTETGRWYLVRGIVFGLYTLGITTQQQLLNINIGQNLINGPANLTYYPGACHCYPTLLFDTEETGEVRIADFAMRPLNTAYSASFLNLNRWINVWAKNNNNTYTQQQVEDMLRYYFIPYNTTFKLTASNSTFTGNKEIDTMNYYEFIG